MIAIICSTGGNLQTGHRPVWFGREDF